MYKKFTRLYTLGVNPSKSISVHIKYRFKKNPLPCVYSMCMMRQPEPPFTDQLLHGPFSGSCYFKMLKL